MSVKEILATGRVRFDDFSVDESLPPANQLMELKEDMLQVEFPGGLLVDVGWYPSFSEGGEFRLVVIRDFEWSSPVYEARCKTLDELASAAKVCIGVVTERTRQ